MKTNELRIGNYLNGKQGHVMVTEIRKNNIVKIQDNISSFYVGTCLEPIPLTEDWLLRFGWKKDSIISEDDSYSFKREIVFIGKTDIRYFGLTTILKYVHELQNLYFAITGEELELKSETN